MRTRTWAALAIGLGLASGTASAQATASGRVAAGAPAVAGAMNDGLFAAAAAGSGLCEVNTARLAVERATKPEVKQFAQRMLDDHTKANSELMALASQKRLSLPTALPISAQAELNALEGATGEEFDKCYVHNQIAAHICAVGLFEAEAKRGQDPQVKAWAAKTLPTLKDHLMTIKKMHEACEAKEKSESSASR